MSEKAVEPVLSPLTLRRLYCAQALFRHEFVPREDAPPPSKEFDFQLRIGYEEEEGDSSHLGVLLRLRIEPDLERNQPYRVDVAYRGDFLLGRELQGMDKTLLAAQNCAAILFPYIRQLIGDLTSRGTNGPVLVPTVNVAAMLHAAQENEEKAAQENEEKKERSRGGNETNESHTRKVEARKRKAESRP